MNYELRITNYDWERLRVGAFVIFYCCLPVFFCGSVFAQNKQNNGYEEAVKTYIETYRDIAVKEMMEYRIPASITMAQGIYESNAGRSRLAIEANNHFGIKCHIEWTGDTFIQDDETKNECFRKYSNPEESFRDHSYFLSQRDRYKSLFNLDMVDYKGWANGLKACGYATNPQYPERLIRTIEDYQLYRLDVADFSLVFSDTTPTVKDTVRKTVTVAKVDLFAEGPGKRMVYLNNGLQYIVFKKNDEIKEVAKAFHVTERKIRKFNDMKKDAPLVAGQMVYLEPKKKKGSITRHIVRQGETLYTISQAYGIELSQVYKINKLKAGHPVRQGQKILLR
jgi:LysM repeat protein